jgi:hypothetical protein
MIRPIRFWLRERRRKKRIFVCPVCHLELSLNDLDGQGYTVCPVCGIVIEVVMSGGFPLPVVHDVEIKRAQPRFRTHATSTHVTIGLLPVSMAFNAAALALSFFLPLYSVHVEKTGLGLFMLSFIGSFATFGLGYWDWRTRYRARPYHFITTKIRLSWLLWVLGAAALYVRFAMVEPGILFSPAFLLYLVLQAAMLGVITVIGHIGGNLVFGK